MNNKRYNLNQNILIKIENCIFQYDMLKPGQEVLVGFSGGKDSTYAALALRELGYKVQLASVDMGYDSDWTERINKNVQEISKLIYDSLITLDKDYNIQSALAVEWSQTGQQSYIIKLRENVISFHLKCSEKDFGKFYLI